MDEVGVRDLCNSGGEVLARETLVTRWRSLPRIDPEAFRADVDAAVDPSL